MSTTSKQQQATVETVTVSATASSVKSVTSARATSRTTQKDQISAKPVRPARSLREKVLKRTTSLRSSISEDASERALSSQPPMSPMDAAAQRIASWDQEEIPPRPIESDDELSEGSSLSENLTTGRPSIILYTTKKTGVHMDVATKVANEMLQKAKDALESAGNMKKECKLTALECLQTLYETVLSLSDSRSRHKHNLEKERHRHAQELVRIERAHNRLLAETIHDISKKLTQTHTDIIGNREETQAIRSWLGYETQEPYKTINTINSTITKLERSIRELAVDKPTPQKDIKGKGEPSPPAIDSPQCLSRLDRLSNQLDELRRGMGEIKAGTDHLIASNKKQTETNITHHTQQPDERLVKGLLEVKEVIISVEKNICQTIKAQPLPQAAPSQEHLQPITERLEAVSSELRTMREIRCKTPPLTKSLGAELAVAELVQNNTKPTYAQIAQKPKAPPRPNHTLIVSSTDPQKTGENVIDNIRAALDLKTTGAKIDRVRKARNQKVVLSCSTKEDLQLVHRNLKKDSTLNAHIAKTNNPLACVRDVLSYHTDTEVAKYILSQNAHLLRDIQEQDISVRVRYRKKARNPLECHLVLELSPEVHKRLTEAGRIYIDLQKRPIEDQSPLVQCTKCLGFGHTKAVCKEVDQLCSYCGGEHTWEECPRRSEGLSPSCKNCVRANTKTNKEHIAFNGECPEKQKWDSIARSRITYC